MFSRLTDPMVPEPRVSSPISIHLINRLRTAA